MSNTNVKLQIEKLRNLLRSWEYEYYSNNFSPVSDQEYDNTLKFLVELESKHPEFWASDSPSVRVSGAISDGFKKVTHSINMLSLENAFDSDDLKKFDKNIKTALGINLDKEIAYCVEPKIDGLSLAIRYQNGTLYRGISRGDGKIGEDLTTNIKTIKSIPLSLYEKKDIEIRGEVFLFKSEFRKINAAIIDEEEKFSNPRHAASGAMRNLDSSVTAKRKLSFSSYFVVNPMKIGLKTQWETIKFLKENKFYVPKEVSLTNNIHEAILKINEIASNRSNYDYPIDGVVLKLNDISLYEQIGKTSKFPKWAIAYKFPALVVETKLNAIKTTVGRTGKINYIASLETVLLDGSNVSSATLHNAEYILAKDIKIGDVVKIFKAGDIIPKVMEPVISKRNGDEVNFVPNMTCPVCYQPLEKIESEVDQYCTNLDCPAKLVEGIIYFVSRKAMNIDKLSRKRIISLYEKGFLQSISDLYKLHNCKKEIIDADLRLKEKALTGIFNSIEDSKKLSLEFLLTGLGIRHVGEVMCLNLAKHFTSLNRIVNAKFEELLLINDMGPVAAKSIVDFFENKPNKKLVESLLFFGINDRYINHNYKVDSPYFQKNICITGSFDKPRITIKSILINRFDAKVANTISESTDYLLTGDAKKESSKYKFAVEHNIKIIDEKIWE